MPDTRLLLLCLPLALAACVNEGASYQIDGPQHSISLLREQKVAWNDEVKQELVVARYPECQRRHEISTGVKSRVEIELFEARPSLYVVHQGADWYATSTENCQLQKFDTPPDASALRRLGAFQYRESKLDFVAAK